MKIQMVKTPEEAQLSKRRVELQLELLSVEGELSGLNVAAGQPKISASMSAALQLIDGAGAMPDADLEQERNALRKRRNALNMAIGEIDNRLKPLRAAREKFALLKEAKPEYLHHVKRLLKAVAEMCAASDAEKNFIEELRDAGFESITAYLPSALFPGEWRDDPNGSAVFYWRRHIRDNYPEVGGVELPDGAPVNTGPVRSNGTVPKPLKATPAPRAAVDDSAWTKRA